MMPWPQCRRSDALRKEGEAKLAAQQAEIEELRARLGEFTKDGVVLTPRPAWTDGEGGEGRSAERVDALRRVLKTERERAELLQGEGAEAKRGREQERAKCVLAEERREKAQERACALEDEVSPKIPPLARAHKPRYDSCSMALTFCASIFRSRGYRRSLYLTALALGAQNLVLVSSKWKSRNTSRATCQRDSVTNHIKAPGFTKSHGVAVECASANHGYRGA